MPEAPFDLAKAATRNNAPVIVDCGVAPGLSHVLAMALHRDMGGLDDLRIYVGGMPLKPPPVFRHAVYFNARDLLSEYIRPARMRERRKAHRPHPLDHPVQELRDGEVGDLEAFLSDGLRSLLRSLPDVPSMSEWTLRAPGHLDFMRMLRALGFLDGDKETDGAARVLGEQFPGAEHPDRLLLEVWGRKGSRTKRYRLHDVRTAGASAMARTTGFTAAAAAVLLARGLFSAPGVHAPEELGRDPKNTAALLEDLAAFGVRVTVGGKLRPR
jgi:saccharopine dehydrogenase-like NADP-dependent oxidoreductase